MKIGGIQIDPLKLEAFGYFFYSVLFVVAVLGNRAGKPEFYMNANIREMFLGQEMDFASSEFPKGFYDLQTQDAVYVWLYEVLVACVWDTDQPCDKCPDWGGKALPFGTQVLVGNGMRMRQLRVKAQPCARRGPDGFEAITEVCYPQYSEATEDRAPYGGPGGNMSTFRWRELDSHERYTFNGWLLSYPPQGYVVDIGVFGDPGSEILDLREKRFLDIQTRALLIDVTMYNPTNKLFTMMRFIFEFPFGGGVLPSFSARVIKLWGNLSSSDRMFQNIDRILLVVITVWVVFSMYKLMTAGFKVYLIDDPYLRLGTLGTLGTRDISG